MNRLLYRLAHPPLNCWFVQSHRNWLAETRRLLPDLPGVNLQSLADPNQLSVSETSGSVVVLEYSDEPLERFMRSIESLRQRRIRVIAVGNRNLGDRNTALIMAGACCVVTSFAGCDKVAEVITRSFQSQSPRLADWRDNIRDRLPWGRTANPGTNRATIPDPNPGSFGLR